MTHVVTDACSGCRFTECVSICPVECFHLGEDMVYIDPVVCIDCGGCIPACPVEAIIDEVDLPEEHLHWVEINKTKATELPLLSAQLDPLPTAEARRAELGMWAVR